MGSRFCLLTARRLTCSSALFGFLLIAAVDAQARQADLSIAKSVNNATPNVGDTVTFTITVVNLGPAIATGASVFDQLPPGLTFVSAITSQGTYSQANGVWTIGTMVNASAATLQIQATVVGANAQTNTATATSGVADPNQGNNTASATVTPQRADLGVVKTVNTPTPNVGDTITFTITLTNAGPNAATGVAVTDLLPAGLTFVSSSASLGTYNSANGTWTVGTRASGAAATLSIAATVAGANTITNTATIAAANQFDPNAGNNSASATITPQRADLAVVKTVSNATPNVGNTITFTITLTNAGPDAATGVAATDLLPAGLTFVSATPTQGSYNSANGAWIVGTLTTTTPATLSISATVAGGNAMSNTATITAAAQFDPVLGNNAATVTVTPRFTDDPLATGVTPIKAVHVTQLRARIDAQRSRFGLGGYGWTTVPLNAGAVVRATQVNELRTALQEAYSAAKSTVPTFTDSPLVLGSTVIRALHINELRSAVIALEGM